jgi:penicillin amidase
VARDAQGVPVITAANRADLARALGFLHGQERFFEMDLLRRAGAGELAALVGAPALPIDRTLRLHRFRARARAALAAQSPAQRALVEAYAQGVNAGLASLGHAPWEYAVLRVAPRPWRAEDTSLVTYAMYFDLQASDADAQLMRAAMHDLLGPAMAAFLWPAATPHDAPIDDSVLPAPAMPVSLGGSGGGAPGEAVPAAEHGSNNFAVAGRLTGTGAAMVANDMHLGLNVPIIWYRARMVVKGAGATPLDEVGVTLPGTPFLVVGSNTHVAWAFTDGYIESGDAVVLDMAPGDAVHYRTPDGVKAIAAMPERICAAHGGCETLTVEDTVWGPVVGRDLSGRNIVWAWTAHDPNAVLTDGFLGLEAARTVREALDAAHRAGMPQQNFVVGDADGHIAWTIIGQVPRRVGLDDQMPHSWADGTHGWRGYLSADEIPEIVDPAEGRVWSANARVVGGAALAKLGDGGYAEGLRAERIRDDLRARDRFTEADLLAIQTDTRAVVLESWQKLLRKAIAGHAGDSKIAALAPYVDAWGGRAVPDSVGYRLVHEFRAGSIALVYGALTAPATARLAVAARVPGRAAWAVERLRTEQPAALLPKPYRNWNEVTGAVLSQIAARVDAAGGANLYTWGAVNRTGIHHPLAKALPAIGWLTDMRDEAMAGDSVIPRVAIPGFGASERLVVSPGHEASGIFDMPVGQASNPLMPYFGDGQEAWVAGKGTPLLPGAARWNLVLVPDTFRP